MPEERVESGGRFESNRKKICPARARNRMSSFTDDSASSARFGALEAGAEVDRRKEMPEDALEVREGQRLAGG